ncbi:unnamed protein product [Prorocentrum cordatum]|uniref:Carboxypeptidase n=1 Tax=Prorocentrum cordatum TaxID=2364126 RepID=A0ABN9U8Z4_9DINO|nr:unnamed protein product [Polarella glacialis]
MGIGNGLTDPQEQCKWYQEYMCTGAGHATPPINSSVECTALKAATAACDATLAACDSGVPAVSQAGCGAAMETCALGFQLPYMATGLNPYDVRIKCDKLPLCYDMSNDVTYLNDKDVQKQLGVDKNFESYNLIVNKAFSLDFMKNSHMLIPLMLAAGIDVLVYSGDQDFICNWLGNEKWVQALEWDHKQEFNAAVKTPYKVFGKEVGELQSFANLRFLRVAQAGHMVPLDQPEAALGMVNDLLAGAFLKSNLEVVV